MKALEELRSRMNKQTNEECMPEAWALKDFSFLHIFSWWYMPYFSHVIVFIHIASLNYFIHMKSQIQITYSYNLYYQFLPSWAVACFICWWLWVCQMLVFLCIIVKWVLSLLLKIQTLKKYCIHFLNEFGFFKIT